MILAWEQYSAEKPEETLWDAVIVGTGMGGATLGYALARKGLKVLFLERGGAPTRFPKRRNAGRLRRLLGIESKGSMARATGRWPLKVVLSRGGRSSMAETDLGTGPGGSTAIYGAALERMRRCDFAEKPWPEGVPAPVTSEWPVDFNEFRKYYAEAEDLYGVCGTRDPLDPDDDSTLGAPPPLSPQDQDFYDSFQAAGLGPYRIHLGIGYRKGCRECIGIPCTTDCKGDSAGKALAPALVQHGARLLLGCEVERLETREGRVTEVIAKRGTEQLRIRASVVVLSAGALMSPRILLQSQSEEWPAGIGNQNDMVGRCAMFHASDFFALRPRKSVAAKGPRKTLSSRALYECDGKRLGSFQSLGMPVTQGNIYEFLDQRLRHRLLDRFPLRRILLRVVAMGASIFFSRSAIFATIMEDFPYKANRVMLDDASPDRIRIEYDDPKEFHERIREARVRLKAVFRAHKPWLLTATADNLNLSHPCGTCRFGNDPQTSVLDPTNKVHGTENLYVVDASFFPSSSAGNPALTIGANALRVAEPIAQQIAKLKARNAGVAEILVVS
jgi:choline dehydrogenase-like flavoprotein